MATACHLNQLPYSKFVRDKENQTNVKLVLLAEEQIKEKTNKSKSELLTCDALWDYILNTKKTPKDETQSGPPQEIQYTLSSHILAEYGIDIGKVLQQMSSNIRLFGFSDSTSEDNATYMGKVKEIQEFSKWFIGRENDFKGFNASKTGIDDKSMEIFYIIRFASILVRSGITGHLPIAPCVVPCESCSEVKGDTSTSSSSVSQSIPSQSTSSSSTPGGSQNSSSGSSVSVVTLGSSLSFPNSSPAVGSRVKNCESKSLKLFLWTESPSQKLQEFIKSSKFFPLKEHVQACVFQVAHAFATLSFFGIEYQKYKDEEWNWDSDIRYFDCVNQIGYFQYDIYQPESLALLTPAKVKPAAPAKFKKKPAVTSIRIPNDGNIFVLTAIHRFVFKRDADDNSLPVFQTFLDYLLKSVNSWNTKTNPPLESLLTTLEVEKLDSLSRKSEIQKIISGKSTSSLYEHEEKEAIEEWIKKAQEALKEKSGENSNTIWSAFLTNPELWGAWIRSVESNKLWKQTPALEQVPLWQYRFGREKERQLILPSVLYTYWKTSLELDNSDSPLRYLSLFVREGKLGEQEKELFEKNKTSPIDGVRNWYRLHGLEPEQRFLNLIATVNHVVSPLTLQRTVSTQYLSTRSELRRLLLTYFNFIKRYENENEKDKEKPKYDWFSTPDQNLETELSKLRFLRPLRSQILAVASQIFSSGDSQMEKLLQNFLGEKNVKSLLYLLLGLEMGYLLRRVPQLSEWKRITNSGATSGSSDILSDSLLQESLQNTQDEWALSEDQQKVLRTEIKAGDFRSFFLSRVQQYLMEDGLSKEDIAAFLSKHQDPKYEKVFKPTSMFLEVIKEFLVYLKENAKKNKAYVTGLGFTQKPDPTGIATAVTKSKS